jgi:hypothetical protein
MNKPWDWSEIRSEQALVFVSGRDWSSSSGKSSVTKGSLGEAVVFAALRGTSPNTHWPVLSL